MLKNRVIPCLLLKNGGLVKTVRFENAKYVGDPINAVKIFNEKEVDELIFIDIVASREKKEPGYELIEKIATECFMPFCYGGGINKLEEINHIISLGAEKVSINSFARKDADFIREAALVFGSQSIVVSIDVKKNVFGAYKVYDSVNHQITNLDPVEFAQQIEKCGAGEILLCSVDRDGTFAGFDIGIIKLVSEKIRIPLIACGGAGKLEDFEEAIKVGGASAVAAGSMFVFHGKHRAVLINYPVVDCLARSVD